MLSSKGRNLNSSRCPEDGVPFWQVNNQISVTICVVCGDEHLIFISDKFPTNASLTGRRVSWMNIRCSSWVIRIDRIAPRSITCITTMMGRKFREEQQLLDIVITRHLTPKQQLQRRPSASSISICREAHRCINPISTRCVLMPCSECHWYARIKASPQRESTFTVVLLLS